MRAAPFKKKAAKTFLMRLSISPMLTIGIALSASTILSPHTGESRDVFIVSILIFDIEFDR
jgi:hypothetical protein